LVSAVTTQRPDLFGAVLCEVPLTDMVRYHKFGPAKTWIHEYGNPENPEHFEFLYDYSPYHNVEPRTDYPAFLMMSSASDDRVHPMHARKFTAALQYADTTPSSPALFRLERKAGHGGAAMVRKEIAKATDRLSFLMDQFGMEPATPGE
ncbi:MAG: prolyl oligopeptidase family serine peptidase, partial [Bradymonadaceae bacterium]